MTDRTGEALVLGIDAGGTSVRAIVCDPAGRPMGAGKAAGANVRSSTGDPAGNLAAAVAQALAAAGVSAPAIAATAVGSAGTGAGTIDRTRTVIADGLARCGISDFELTQDTAIAFRSIAPSSDGVLLLAGTGAVAMRYQGWQATDRCDGMGWLLGDEGSGVWIGRRALEAAAADLDGRGPQTQLTARVVTALHVTGDLRQGLIAALDGLRPADWAHFSRDVTELDGRDAVATTILDQAAVRLLATAQGVAVGTADDVVLAGGMLGAEALRGRVTGLLQSIDVSVVGHAAHPVVGACDLAAQIAGFALDKAALLSAL